jgi:hypothetical protein
MQILKNTHIYWLERRVISKLYIGQSATIRLDQEVTRRVKSEKGVRQGCCVSPILFDLYSEYPTSETLKGFEDFKTGQVICAVKYADDLVLLAEEETMLQGVTERLIKGGKYHGKKKNVENS